MTDRLEHPDDLSAMAAEDALLDALAAGDPAPADDALAGLLATWREELDDAAAASAQASSLVPRQRWTRTHRGTAGMLTAVVVLAASTGVAAAASGPHGPLGGVYKFLTGGGSAISKTTDVDVVGAQVSRLLDGIGTDLGLAQAAGDVTVGQRARLTARLDRAAALLATDPAPPAGLSDRLAVLRAALAGLPGPPTPHQPTTGPSADSHHGSGSSSGSDDGTSGGSGGSGGSGSDDGSGGGRSGGSGSDDGSGSSGDGGATGSGSGSGGSDDGGSGTGSGSGSGGSDDGGSGSGSGGGSGD